MEKVLIAYNNAPDTELHSFFESCADDAKQFCVDYNHNFTPVWPPDLTEQNVVVQMDKYTICFVASHGDKDGVYNEDSDAVISTHTMNYNLSGKTLYAISCECAKNLMPVLKQIGLETFVGYDETFRVVESEPMFRISAMEGLKAILEGNDKKNGKNRMFEIFDEFIKKAQDDTTKMLLLHNREHLCFE